MNRAHALGCLLFCAGFGCNAPKPSRVESKPGPLPLASVSAAATPLPAPSASCAQPKAPRLDPVDLKVGPLTQPLGARLGLWLADEQSALLDANPDPAWSEGSTSSSGPNSATRAVAMARLPKALRAWLGHPVKVLGANGAVCETRLQRFLIRAQITPDLRTAEHWEGCSDEPAIAPDQIADEVWRVTAKAGRSLIAEFSAPCKGALLAVDPDLPAPAIAAPEPASAEVGADAISAFRQLPEYAQIQARFRSEQPAVSGSWDDHEARRSISTLALPGHTPLFVVSVQVGTGCTGFSAALSALWGGGGPALALTAIDDRRLSPSAIVDLDGSGGGAILLGPDGLWSTRSVLRRKRDTDKTDVTRFERVFLSSVPFFPGPC
ncbi:MAG: hypothetical protein ABW061_25205 [Polyangiaceae bacterium]